MVFQKQQPKRTVTSILAEVVNKTNDNTQRLRHVEQKVDSLVSRLQSLGEEILDYRKAAKKSASEMNGAIDAHEKRVLEIERGLKEVVSQIKKMPTKLDVGKLEELIEIYNPLKSNFVTREEMERIVERRK